MPNSTQDKPGMLDAGFWTASYWLTFLCSAHVLIVIIYLLFHGFRKNGYEYITLTADQQKAFAKLINSYADNEKPTSILAQDAAADTTKKPLYLKMDSLRTGRAAFIKSWLMHTLHGDENDAGGNERIKPQLDSLRPLLLEYNTGDATNLIFGYPFKVDSYFWLAGNRMYWESFFWSLFGVFVSLIFYVSAANKKTLTAQPNPNEDIGPFDPAELSGQIAKMFYAPAVTLVFVIGYNYFSDKNQGVVDISVNHGLILFSFVAGFYSGRLMKLLDNIKNSLLPADSISTGSSTPTTPAPSTGVDVTVTLSLDSSVANGPDGNDITEAGFNKATVTLTPGDGSGKVITLDPPSDDQGAAFKTAKVAPGKYALKAVLPFTKDTTIINLSASQDIEIAADKASFELALKQDVTNG